MGFKKGQSGNPAGKPKGAKNKTQNGLRILINEFLSNNWSQVEMDFQKLEAKEKIVFYERLLKYALPQLQSVSHTHDMEKQLERLTDDQLKELMDRVIEHLAK